MSKARRCSACGRANEADARFCSGCGSPLTVEAPQREARKVLTALFVDVVGSTALGERLDPEDLQAVVGDGVACAVRAAEALGGHVDRTAGDGALIIFGAPVAHEDDPERAVLAGLRILDEISSYATELRAETGIEDFAVRVGVETGLAVLASVGERAIEFGAMGDVLNTAARLEASAQPGTMLVGPHTYELVEAGFEWDQPVELRLKGKDGVVVARRPLSARAAGASRPVPARESPLVGRARELEVLGRAGGELLSGKGGAVIVSGEPGLGKTRLLLELRRRIAANEDGTDGARWLEGRCASYGEGLPYFPFRRLLRSWLGAEPDADDPEVAALLADRSESLFGARGEQVSAYLATALGLPSPAEGSEGWRAAQPEDMQMRAFAAVEELVELLSGQGPLALAFEDLQWADPTSLKLCERLVSLAERLPVLLLFTIRPEQDRPAAKLRERVAAQPGEGSTVLELAALGEAADRELLGALTGGGTLPPDFERRVLERAEGNPLYIEELVRSLLDTGALAHEGDGWRFAPEAEVQVPETVEKLILARVDRLSPGGRDLLCAASVLGRRFSSPVLEALTGDASALVELQEADLIRPERDSPELEFRFKHHLIQEATYGTVLKRRRQQLHRRAAETLADDSRQRGDTRLGLLAHHWAAAGEHDRALGYHRRAGEAASRIGSTSEAISHYDGGADGLRETGAWTRGRADPTVDGRARTDDDLRWAGVRGHRRSRRRARRRPRRGRPGAGTRSADDARLDSVRGLLARDRDSARRRSRSPGRMATNADRSGPWLDSRSSTQISCAWTELWSKAARRSRSPVVARTRRSFAGLSTASSWRSSSSAILTPSRSTARS